MSNMISANTIAEVAGLIGDIEHFQSNPDRI